MRGLITFFFQNLPVISFSCLCLPDLISFSDFQTPDQHIVAMYTDCFLHNLTLRIHDTVFYSIQLRFCIIVHDINLKHCFIVFKRAYIRFDCSIMLCVCFGI